jgi:hypothetical protein
MHANKSSMTSSSPKPKRLFANAIFDLEIKKARR